MTMSQMRHQQKPVEVAPFSPFQSFLRHASVLNLKLNAGQSYINATNPLIPHIAQTLQQ